MLLLSVMIIGFLLLSGLMALVDAAILSVTPAEVETMRKKQLLGAVQLAEIKKNMPKTVSTIVIMTNIVNILGPIIVGTMAVQVFGTNALAYSTIALVVGTIIFSEALPKALGASYAPFVARISAIPLIIVNILLSPLSKPLALFTSMLSRNVRKVGTEQQIRSLTDLGALAGHIDQGEDQLIDRAFELNDTTAENAMVPMHLVTFVQPETTIAKAAELVLKQSYSRYPVVSPSLEPIGMVLSRDILQAIVDGNATDLVITIVRPCLMIDRFIKANVLLNQFREEKTHLALIKEHNKVVGIVTLEDILEELVGEIEDEKDVET